MLAIPCESNDKREMGIGKEKQEGWRGEEAGKHLRGRYYWRCPPRVRGGEGLSPKLPYAGVMLESDRCTGDKSTPRNLQIPIICKYRHGPSMREKRNPSQPGRTLAKSLSSFLAISDAAGSLDA